MKVITKRKRFDLTLNFSTYSKGKSMEIGQENLYVDIGGFKG